MKYRVHYTYFDQAVNKAAKWEQREKDFETKEEARNFVKKIDWSVSVRNINIQPVPWATINFSTGMTPGIVKTM